MGECKHISVEGGGKGSGGGGGQALTCVMGGGGGGGIVGGFESMQSLVYVDHKIVEV